MPEKAIFYSTAQMRIMANKVFNSRDGLKVHIFYITYWAHRPYQRSSSRISPLLKSCVFILKSYLSHLTDRAQAHSFYSMLQGLSTNITYLNLMEWASPIIAPVLTQNRLVKSLGKLHFRSPCASEALNPFEQKEGRPTKEQNPTA